MGVRGKKYGLLKEGSTVFFFFFLPFLTLSSRGWLFFHPRAVRWKKMVWIELGLYIRSRMKI